MLVVFGITCLVVVGLMLFACQTKYDFTGEESRSLSSSRQASCPISSWQACVFWVSQAACARAKSNQKPRFRLRLVHCQHVRGQSNRAVQAGKPILSLWSAGHWTWLMQRLAPSSSQASWILVWNRSSYAYTCQDTLCLTRR